MRGSLLGGADYLMRGARMLKRPRLLPFVAIPLLVNIAIFASLIVYALGTIGGTVLGWLTALPGWLSFLDWIIWPLVYLALALFSGYLFTALAILIASPFNGLLAEKAEELITGERVAGAGGLLGAIALFPRAMARELRKFLYYLPLLLLTFVLSWFASGLAPLLWLLFGAWMMAVQYVDYPMDNHQRSFADVKRALRERRLSSLGFGGLVAMVSGIPLLNFFVMPASVVGATLFWCEELRPSQAEGIRADGQPRGAGE